jgi:hypothetical protein
MLSSNHEETQCSGSLKGIELQSVRALGGYDMSPADRASDKDQRPETIQYSMSDVTKKLRRHS